MTDWQDRSWPALPPACCAHRFMTASVAQAEDERVRWNMASWFPSSLTQLGTLGKSMVDRLDRHLRRQHPDQVLRAQRADPGEGVLRRRGRRLGRCLLVDARLLVRQGARARDVRGRALRPAGGRVHRLDLLRRRLRAVGFDLRAAWAEVAALRHHRARGVRLVPQGDQVDRRPRRPEDALLRARRQGDGEDRRLHPAHRRRRHLPGAGARLDRRHRVLDAGDRPQSRLLPGRQALLLPRLAPAVDRSSSCS